MKVRHRLVWNLIFISILQSQNIRYKSSLRFNRRALMDLRIQFIPSPFVRWILHFLRVNRRRWASECTEQHGKEHDLRGDPMGLMKLASYVNTIAAFSSMWVEGTNTGGRASERLNECFWCSRRMLTLRDQSRVSLLGRQMVKTRRRISDTIARLCTSLLKNSPNFPNHIKSIAHSRVLNTRRDV
jgi:hypothetical protein